MDISKPTMRIDFVFIELEMIKKEGVVIFFKGAINILYFIAKK